MDPSFYMQRYWGSDDSDIEDENNKSKSDEKKLKNLLELVKENRSSKIVTDCDVDASKNSEIQNGESESLPKKRKRKSLKEIKQEEITITDESETLTTDLVKLCNEDNVFSPKQKNIITNDLDETEQPLLIGNGKNSEATEDNASSRSKKKKLVVKSKESVVASKSESDTSIKRKKKKKLPNAAESLNQIPPDCMNSQNELNLDGKDDNLDNAVPSSRNERSKKEQISKMFPVIEDVCKKIEPVSRILPDWLSKPTFIVEDIQGEKIPVSELSFLDSTTKENLTKSNIEYLFPVQFQVIPWLLQSSSKRFIVRPSDLCVSAPTGSGKTLAFVIPIIQSLKSRVVQNIRAVVVLPVGDLAVQVCKVFQAFCRGTDLKVALVVGQKSFKEEQSNLVKQCSRGFMTLADIIVCTPGRLMDHISYTSGFTLESLQYLVIDEADRMMEEIQHGWLKRVEEAIFKSKKNLDCKCFGLKSCFQKIKEGPSSSCSFGCITEPMQKLLYSATLSQDPDKLHKLSLYRPKLFTAPSQTSAMITKHASTDNESNEFIGKYTTPKSLKEYYVVCDTSVKPLIVCCLSKKNNFKKILCFTGSLEHAHRLYLVLKNMNLKVREISSNLRAVQRKIILDQFANGKFDILVCSDIMARGMDIDDIDCVISYDLPAMITRYVHRIGRTARAGKEGVAITLLEGHEVSQFKNMLESAGKLSPVKFEIDDSNLKCFEASFKTALGAVSKEIANEKSALSMKKKTAEGNFKNKKSFSKNVNSNNVRKQMIRKRAIK